MATCTSYSDSPTQCSWGCLAQHRPHGLALELNSNHNNIDSIHITVCLANVTTIAQHRYGKNEPRLSLTFNSVISGTKTPRKYGFQ